MGVVRVHGASDDLIEVDGDLSEEFGGGGREGDLLYFSDGTVLRVTYTDSGVWRVTLVKRGSAKLTIVQAPEGDEEDDTDVAMLEGDVTWVRTGGAFRLGEVAYSGYFKASGGKSLKYGDDLPSWDEQDPRIQEAWQAAAEAVVEHEGLT